MELSVYDTPILQYNEELSEKDPCPKEMSTAGASLDYEEYGLVNGFVQYYIKNEGKAARAINPIVKKDAEGSIAESKDEHTDIKDIRHMKVRGAILEEEKGENREFISQRIEGLNARGNNNSLSI
jgi:hypothetical protein